MKTFIRFSFTLVQVFTFSLLPAISNINLPKKGHKPNSLLNKFTFDLGFNRLDHQPSKRIAKSIYQRSQLYETLKRFFIEETFDHSYSGVHPINNYGWFITTKQIANKIEGFDDVDGHRHVKIFCKAHKDYDLALVKFHGFQNPDQLDETTLLKYVSKENDWKDSQWVLSLAHLSHPIYENDKERVYPIQCISEVTDKEKEILILNKGRLKNFYREGRLFCKENQLALYKELLNKVQNCSTEEYKPTFREYFLKKEETSLNITRNVINKQKEKLKQLEKYFNDDLQKIEFQRRMFISYIGSFDAKIVAYEDLSRTSLNDPTVLEKWNEEFQKFSSFLKQKRQTLLKEKELLENHIPSYEEIAGFWGFKNPRNGVPDTYDIGGGIFSYPKYYPLPDNYLSYNSMFHYSYRYPLVGMTLSIGIEGQTSSAINLSHPNIRKWMFELMNQTYKKG